ncbi:MAG: YhbY family RNA-binding protein, partial [Pseudomonadota bacterium]
HNDLVANIAVSNSNADFDQLMERECLFDFVTNILGQALAFHELIKISIRVGDRDVRDQIIVTICDDFGATRVQRTGNVALFFRRNLEQPKVVLGSR